MEYKIERGFITGGEQPMWVGEGEEDEEEEGGGRERERERGGGVLSAYNSQSYEKGS